MNRILIVRMSALGDIVHALPVLAALKARDAALGWELLEAHITSAMRRQIGI